ncbi:hypothetical protein CBR_g8102 [Chara braunii]|uniref:Uncharacterized protein n=1 Tax=Chara braunii TaxID=69332 RepID=A0A388KL81_CHABU|nr:hypothetical protein CBR_g8102 [Chara braunii]|eukprot:GBG70802.1 hypothetical protein CBR_g8102 [Chara braunii]
MVVDVARHPEVATHEFCFVGHTLDGDGGECAEIIGCANLKVQDAQLMMAMETTRDSTKGHATLVGEAEQSGGTLADRRAAGDYFQALAGSGQKAPHVTEKAASDRKTIKAVRPLVPVRNRRELCEWQVATDVSFATPTVGDQLTLARALREGIFEDFHLEVYGIPSPPTEDSDKTIQELATAKSFEPILVKLEEKARLNEGLVWRAWNTVTALPYSTLAGKWCLEEVMIDSLASIITSHILSSEHSLEDEALVLQVEREDDDGSMGEDDDDDGPIDIFFPDSDGIGTTQRTECSIGEYSLGSASEKRTNEDCRGTGADNVGTTAAAD